MIFEKKFFAIPQGENTGAVAATTPAAENLNQIFHIIIAHFPASDEPLPRFGGYWRRDTVFVAKKPAKMGGWQAWETEYL